MFTGQAVCQDTAKAKIAAVLESAEIEYVGQFPLPDSMKENIGFGQWVGNLVFGKKTSDLTKPVSMLMSENNKLWILDQGSQTVYATDDKHKGNLQPLKKNKTTFPSLVGICSFENKEILFTDSYLNKIFVLSSDGQSYRNLNDSLVLQQPTGIAFSEVTGEIWVVETAVHRIAVLDTKGNLIRTIGTRGSGWGEFNYPTNIWIDKNGNVYIIDSMNFRIQVLNSSGDVFSVFGKEGDASGYFARPKGIATDSYGNIYVTDALFNVVQIFDVYGNFLFNFGSQGHDAGQFWMPSGIYIDADNKIYVADSYNSRIQEFQLTNIIKK